MLSWPLAIMDFDVSSAGPRGVEAARWLREDLSTRQSRSRDQCSYSWHRITVNWSELQWCQSPLPPEPCLGTSHSRHGMYSSPSPSLPCLHPTDKQSNNSLSVLHLPCQQQESRSRMWIDSTPRHTIGHPHCPLRLLAEFLPLAPAQKQVQFDLSEDLGEALSLPTDLANFLGEDSTDEWD